MTGCQVAFEEDLTAATISPITEQQQIVEVDTHAIVHLGSESVEPGF
jgi:hypothetical protein